MDRTIFTYTKGFPFDVNVLEFMQQCYNGTASHLCRSLGDNVILYGMHNISNEYTDGCIIYDNEILPFKGGDSAATRFKVVEKKVQLKFEDDIFRDVHLVRTAELTTDLEGIPISSLARVDSLKAVSQTLGQKVDVSALGNYRKKGARDVADLYAHQGSSVQISMADLPEGRYFLKKSSYSPVGITDAPSGVSDGIIEVTMIYSEYSPTFNGKKLFRYIDLATNKEYVSNTDNMDWVCLGESNTGTSTNINTEQT